MKNTGIIIICILTLIPFWSCNGVKNCTAPQLDMPATYSHGSVDSLSIADIEWWKFYGDTVLCHLVSQALERNKDVLVAAKRVEEMRALYGSVKSNMLPTLSGNAYADHKTNDYGGSHATRDFEAGIKFSISWEADLWKRLSWSRKKGESLYRASMADQRAMNMTIVAEVAETYFRLLALDCELDIVKQTLLTRSEGLKQAKLRFEGGLTSEMVYRQAEVEYATAASLVPSLEERIKLAENALLLLTGEYAGAGVVRPHAILSEVVVNEPDLGIPSFLLVRRPDLQSAEFRLRAAMADVGIAYADRFPRFTIGLTGGAENDDLSHLLKSPFSYVIGSLTSPILDFGKRKKEYEASLARYEQSRLLYEKSVMTAFKEVNDAVTSYRSSRLSAQLKTELLEAARKYVDLSRLQYEGGTSLYIDVLDAQRRYFDAQIALSNSVRDEYIALVQLYKSLGGGW